MTPQQLTTLKTYIDSQPDLSSDPNNDDGFVATAKKLNAVASPAYLVWRSSVARTEIYNTTGDGGSTWAWDTYKGQSTAEQGAWREMFMGDSAPFDKLNTRVGVGKIFSGTGAQAAQRDHVLSIGRRQVTRAEKLFAVAVTNPPANTGNDGVAGNRGTATNPDVMTFEGLVTASDVQQARNP